MGAPGFSADPGGGEPLEVEGWAALDHLAPDQQDRLLADQLDNATLYRQCFSSNAGRYVLADFMDLFLKVRIVQPGDDQFAVGIRQGQADVVMRILSMIEFANTGGGKLTGSGVPPSEE